MTNCEPVAAIGIIADVPRYDKRHFLDHGIDHVEMYFDDGTNPSDDIVREFIRLAEETIEGRRMKVAVHCKAGLGRTGVLIGGEWFGFSSGDNRVDQSKHT